MNIQYFEKGLESEVCTVLYPPVLNSVDVVVIGKTFCARVVCFDAKMSNFLCDFLNPFVCYFLFLFHWNEGLLETFEL